MFTSYQLHSSISYQSINTINPPPQDQNDRTYKNIFDYTQEVHLYFLPHLHPYDVPPPLSL